MNKAKEKTYLVTGAAGFIGSILAKKLVDEGNTVVTVDNLSTGYRTNIPEGVIFIEGNCQDQAIIDHLKQWKFEAVFHIAGQSSGEVSYDDPVYDLQTNTQSTLQLLQMCVKTGCNKFIYASSMSVYGQVSEVFMPVKESEVCPKPESFYGIGKLASEHYLRLYQAQYGIATASLRLFNVYGPGQNLENMRQGMVSIFLAQALKTGSVHVKGSADRFRDFVYIDDVISAFLKAEYYLSKDTNLVLNICTEKKHTVAEVINFIVSEVSETIKVKYEGSTPGDQFGIFGSNAHAQKVLEWKPKTDMKDGMKNMLNWAKQLNS